MRGAVPLVLSFVAFEYPLYFFCLIICHLERTRSILWELVAPAGTLIKAKQSPSSPVKEGICAQRRFCCIAAPLRVRNPPLKAVSTVRGIAKSISF